MPTVKQEMVLRELPHNEFNLSKTMRKVGYSPWSARSGESHQGIRKLITKKYYDAEFVKKETSWLYRQAKKAGKHDLALKILSLMSDHEAMKTENKKIETKDVTDKEQSILDKYITPETKHD